MTHLEKQHEAPVVSGSDTPIPSSDGNHPEGVETLVPGSLLRTTFGVVLFVIWGVATILWIWTDIHFVMRGHWIVAVTSIGALALMSLLGGMEGLEVSVIDRWQNVWPGHPQSYLAGWLAARQLFVALIVTTATLLAQRSAIFIPFTSAALRGVLATGVFDIAWTTLTVLWFAQILPKHLGAINPDRYLYRLRPVLFPIVAVVHKIGISQPAEWTAHGVERRLEWSASPEEVARERGLPEPPRSIWAELRRPHHQSDRP